MPLNLKKRFRSVLLYQFRNALTTAGEEIELGDSYTPLDKLIISQSGPNSSYLVKEDSFPDCSGCMKLVREMVNHSWIKARAQLAADSRPESFAMQAKNIMCRFEIWNGGAECVAAYTYPAAAVKAADKDHVELTMMRPDMTAAFKKAVLQPLYDYERARRAWDEKEIDISKHMQPDRDARAVVKRPKWLKGV